MERLTKRIFVPKEERELVVFTHGEYIDTIPAEMTHEDIRKVLRKLAKYEDLEEQGLLLRLPCNVGTSVYMVAQDCGGDTLDCMRGDCEGCPYLYSFVEENKFETYMLEGIGKTVFLTQAEAEQKLKEMDGD